MEIKSIKDLLMSNGYPVAWIQGHHTRIVMDDNEIYTVLRKENPDSQNSSYIRELYRGEDEIVSVFYFIESENT